MIMVVRDGIRALLPSGAWYFHTGNIDPHVCERRTGEIEDPANIHAVSGGCYHDEAMVGGITGNNLVKQMLVPDDLVTTPRLGLLLLPSIREKRG